MFGNKQQHGYKENCVLSSYSVPIVLYTEVLKRKIQYFAIIRVFIISQEWAFLVHALLHVNSVNLTIIYV